MISFAYPYEQVLAGLVQGLLFFIFYFCFKKYLMIPVQSMFNRRKEKMDSEGVHSQRAQRDLASFREEYRIAIEHMHRDGKNLLARRQDKAAKDARSLFETEKAKIETMITSEREKLRSQCTETSRQLASIQDELVAAITSKLWGGK